MDFVISGYPCKDLSTLNSSRYSFTDKRGKTGRPRRGLMSYIEKHASVQVARFENVKGIASLTKENGHTRPIDLQDQIMSDMNFTCGHYLANSCKFMLPQSRERMWMLYIKRGRGDASCMASMMKRLQCKPFPLADVIKFKTGARCRASNYGGRAGCKWTEEIAQLAKAQGIQKRDLKAKATEIKNASQVTLSDRAAHIISYNVLKMMSMKVPITRTTVVQIDQQPSRSDRNLSKLDQLPCITPHGRFYAVKRGSFLDGAEYAKVQGISSHELDVLFCDDFRKNDAFVQDCVGNGFSTTVCCAAVLVALSLWRQA